MGDGTPWQLGRVLPSVGDGVREPAAETLGDSWQATGGHENRGRCCERIPGHRRGRFRRAVVSPVLGMRKQEASHDASHAEAPPRKGCTWNTSDEEVRKLIPDRRPR